MQNILKRLNIPLRNIKEATKTSTCRNKYKQTCLEHFGTEHNFSKNCPSRKQRENRLLETEGITNVFQRQTVKDKIKKTLYTNFGENAHNVINYPNNQHIAAETGWKCDLFKKEYAELQGYQVIYLWESDINNPEKFNIIKNAFQRYGEIENSENRKNANT